MPHPCFDHWDTCDHCYSCDVPLVCCSATTTPGVTSSAVSTDQPSALHIVITHEITEAPALSLGELVLVELTINRPTHRPQPLALPAPEETVVLFTSDREEEGRNVEVPVQRH